MTEATAPTPEAGPPTLAEASSWIGFELDEANGGRVARIRGVFTDADSGQAAWLIVALRQRGFLSRRRSATLVAIPVRDCAGAAGRVWTAHRRDALSSAPTVDPTRPLLREHELTICAQYGIGEKVGRAAEVVGRPEGAVTSQPV
jgi:hypothetical protein